MIKKVNNMWVVYTKKHEKLAEFKSLHDAIKFEQKRKEKGGENK